jgi:rubrerythrin
MQDERLAGIIDAAIQREEEAYGFYTGLIEKIQDGNVRQTIEFIAEEEKKHKAFLEDYRAGKFGDLPIRLSDVVYYKIAEYQEEPKIKTNMPSENVYLLAAHREKRSYEFYTEMAGLHSDDVARDLLLRMANEELKHKEKMEYLYANTAFPQTDGG